MAAQQLNLLDARLLPRSLPFSALQAAVATLAVAVGTWSAAFALSHTVASAKLAPPPPLAALPAPVDLGPLQRELEQLREFDAAQRRLHAALQAGGDGGARADYSAVFVALARQANANLWITGFTVSAAGSAVELEGRMTDAAVLPSYLRGLNREAPFAGRAFAQLQLGSVETADTPEPRRVSAFTLRAQPAAAGPDR